MTVDKTTISSLETTANSLIKSKRYLEAIAVLQSLVRLDPNNWGTYYAMGICLANLKRYPESINAYDRALTLNPNYAAIWNLRGVSYFELKSYKQAANDFSQAIKIDPTLVIAQKNLQNAQKKLKKPKSIISSILVFFLFLIAAIFVLGALNHPSDQSTAPLSSITPLSTPLPTLNSGGSIVGIVTPTPTQTSIGITDPNVQIASKISQAIDWQNSIVKNFATAQVQHISQGYYNIYQVCDIWKPIHDEWTYVQDPPDFNYWTSASNSISNGLKGNCADYAVVNAAVMESIGGSTRIITACAPGGSPCHAYAEAYISNNYDDLQAITDSIAPKYNAPQIYYHSYIGSDGKTEYWLNLDWQANYPGGPFFEDDGSYEIFYPDGTHDAITNSASTIITQTESLHAKEVLSALSGASASTPSPTQTPDLALLALKNSINK
jgi:tetratricopeptide (TPR) repeat protein